MTWLKEWVNTFWGWLYAGFTWILQGVIEVLLAVVKLIFDGFLMVVYAFVASLDLGTYAVNSAASWGALDPNAAYMINAIGIPQGLTMLGGAYTIRILLNFIPAAITRV